MSSPKVKFCSKISASEVDKCALVNSKIYINTKKMTDDKALLDTALVYQKPSP